MKSSLFISAFPVTLNELDHYQLIRSPYSPILSSCNTLKKALFATENYEVFKFSSLTPKIQPLELPFQVAQIAMNKRVSAFVTLEGVLFLMGRDKYGLLGKELELKTPNTI